MRHYFARRGLAALTTVWMVVTIVFFLLRLLPGDPAQLMLGLEAPAERVREVRALFGFDRPLYVQYAVWLADLLRGDFGVSLHSREAVTTLIASRVAVTFWLALLALLIALAIALPLGMAAALRPWSWIDLCSLVIAQLGLAVPSFWLGILLLLVFAVKLQWLPLLGYVNFTLSPAHWLEHLLLPAFALGVIRAAILTRMFRLAFLEELGKEYVMVARAKGLPERRVLFHHTLRNALLPVVTIAGLQLGYLFGGAIIIEQIFGLPGIGRLLLTAISGRDFPLLQGLIAFMAIVFTGLNLLIDLLYGLLNPKIAFAA